LRHAQHDARLVDRFVQAFGGEGFDLGQRILGGKAGEELGGDRLHRGDGAALGIDRRRILGREQRGEGFGDLRQRIRGKRLSRFRRFRETRGMAFGEGRLARRFELAAGEAALGQRARARCPEVVEGDVEGEFLRHGHG
jgi:hypothetical protein